MCHFNLLSCMFTENEIWRSSYIFDINYPIVLMAAIWWYRPIKNIYILCGVGNESFIALQTSDWNHCTLCKGINSGFVLSTILVID